MRTISLVTILSLACAGCQTAQVRKHSVDLDAEVPIYYNQLVLDNIAMATTAGCNLPYFAQVNQATSQNTRGLQVAAQPSWTVTVSRTLGLPFTGSDTDAATLQLTPITDPNKLELLHELFRAAAYSGCDNSTVPEGEIDTLKRYYNAHHLAYFDYSSAVFWVDGSDPFDRSGGPPKPICVPATPCAAAHNEPGQWPTRYQVLSCRWFCVGNSHEVPAHACYVGHYCDTYVWVPPQNVDQLRRMVMAALDIAGVDITQLKLSGAPKEQHLKEQYERTPEPLRSGRFDFPDRHDAPATIAPPITPASAF